MKGGGGIQLIIILDGVQMESGFVRSGRGVWLRRLGRERCSSQGRSRPLKRFRMSNGCAEATVRK